MLPPLVEAARTGGSAAAVHLSTAMSVFPVQRVISSRRSRFSCGSNDAWRKGAAEETSTHDRTMVRIGRAGSAAPVAALPWRAYHISPRDTVSGEVAGQIRRQRRMRNRGIQSSFASRAILTLRLMDIPSPVPCDLIDVSPTSCPAPDAMYSAPRIRWWRWVHGQGRLCCWHWRGRGAATEPWRRQND